MATGVGRDQGKSDFVREVLRKNNKANAKAVNLAWKQAGHDGTISGSLVNKLRSKLGMTGNLRMRKGAKPGAPKSAEGLVPRRGPGRPRGSGASAALLDNGEGIGSTSAPPRPRRLTAGSRTLDTLEAELDRLLYQVMDHGNLPEVETALRTARRHLILGPHN